MEEQMSASIGVGFASPGGRFDLIRYRRRRQRRGTLYKINVYIISIPLAYFGQWTRGRASLAYLETLPYCCVI